MDSPGRFLMSSTFLLWLCLQSTQLGAAAQTAPSPTSLNLLTTVCKHDQDFNSCLKFLESVPGLSSATSLKDVATTVLQLATEETKNMVYFFAGLSHKKGTPTDQKQALKQCVNYFEEAVGDFRPGLIGGGKASVDVVAKAFFDDEFPCEEVLANALVPIDSIEPKLEKWKKFYNAAYVSLEALV